MDKDFSADTGSEALPSIATLERYVGGEMATDERERLEAQIAKDPLLADAVEGLRMSLGEADHTARLSRIRSRVASSVEAMPQTESLGSKRKSRVKPFPQYLVYTAVAAGFALLLVFVGLMRNGENSEEAQNPEMITQNQITEPESAPTETTGPTNVEQPAAETPISSVEQQAPQARTSPRGTPAPQPESYEESLDSWTNTDDQALSVEEAMSDETAEENDFGAVQNTSSPVPDPVVVQQVQSPTTPANEPPSPPASYTTAPQRERQEEDLAKMAREAIPEETEVIREPTRPASTSPFSSEQPLRQVNTTPQVDFNTDDLQYQDEADQTAGAVSKAQVMADLLTEAIRLHDEEKLDSANLLLDEVLLSEKNNVVASYYKGKSLTDQKKFSEAIPFLLTAYRVETSAVFEEAQWQLAQAYLGAEKKRKARSLLTTISEGTGKYQPEAAELLRNMD